MDTSANTPESKRDAEPSQGGLARSASPEQAVEPRKTSGLPGLRWYVGDVATAQVLTITSTDREYDDVHPRDSEDEETKSEQIELEQDFPALIHELILNAGTAGIAVGEITDIIRTLRPRDRVAELLRYLIGHVKDRLPSSQQLIYHAPDSTRGARYEIKITGFSIDPLEPPEFGTGRVAQPAERRAIESPHWARATAAAASPHRSERRVPKVTPRTQQEPQAGTQAELRVKTFDAAIREAGSAGVTGPTLDDMVSNQTKTGSERARLNRRRGILQAVREGLAENEQLISVGSGDTIRYMIVTAGDGTILRASWE